MHVEHLATRVFGQKDILVQCVNIGTTSHIALNKLMLRT